MSRMRVAVFLMLSSFVATAFAAGVKVVYPADEGENDMRFSDLKEILQTALEKTVSEFGPYELQQSSEKMTGTRYLFELERGREINIAWSSTSEEMEKVFLPLRIPLRKGILGYRISLISKDKQAQVDQVKTIDDLKKLTIGQGQGWGDVKLYEANGIKVVQARYLNLFKMTTLDRFDLFPRGIGEVFAEYALHSKDNPKLAIEKNLLIHYPWPYYFFFNKNDVALRNRIEAGIRKMMKDGSFDAIFMKYNGKAIEEANLSGRRVINIKNHMLPKETPLNDASLWFHPGKDSKDKDRPKAPHS